MEWMLLPLKRYADFQARSRRMEYWMFTLGYFLLFMVLGMLAVAAGAAFHEGQALSGGAVVFVMLIGVVLLGLLIPTIAVQVRRLHDQDISGWWVLGFYICAFIPILSFFTGIAMLVFMCLPGTRGENRFGPDPLDPRGTQNLSDVFR